MTPYYEDESCVIYHGDCREILPRLEFDVVVTDPPYGIALDTDYSVLSGSTRTYEPAVGDDVPFDPSFLLPYKCVLFGANHYAHRLPPGGTWHVWDKRESAASNILADFEAWWTSFQTGPSRIFRYQWICAVHPGAPRDLHAHPTVKPIPVMREVLEQTEGVIVDPFMGSGSTLRAAKDLGRKAVGIELEERYCEIAAERLGQEVLDMGAAA